MIWVTTIAIIVAIYLGTRALDERLQQVCSRLDDIHHDIESVRISLELKDDYSHLLNQIKTDMWSGFVVVSAIAYQVRDGERGEPTAAGRRTTSGGAR
jgi:hypothetical protein